jgi:hypothetical protein
VLVVALALGWWLDKRPAAAGRFQLHTPINDQPGHTRANYIIDTATGQVWLDSSAGFYDPKPAK